MGLNFNDSKVPYTYHYNKSYSTIDHFLVTKNISQYITRYESLFMLDDFSDHVPLRLELNVNINCFKTIPRTFTQSTSWQKCSLDDKQEFVNNLDRLLLQINIQQDAVKCKNLNCNIHIDSIRKMYNEIIMFCLEADEKLPKTKSGTIQNDIAVGWSDYVKEQKDYGQRTAWSYEA